MRPRVVPRRPRLVPEEQEAERPVRLGDDADRPDGDVYGHRPARTDREPMTVAAAVSRREDA
jgi:hypothetical protein